MPVFIPTVLVDKALHSRTHSRLSLCRAAAGISLLLTRMPLLPGSGVCFRGFKEAAAKSCFAHFHSLWLGLVKQPMSPQNRLQRALQSDRYKLIGFYIVCRSVSLNEKFSQESHTG